MSIGVIGRGDNCEPEAYALAEQVGGEIARRGHMLVCGGMTGVMEAVCKGAKAVGGATIGILPGEDPRAANRWVDIPIVTGLGYARNAIVALTASAVIAVYGEYGTLTEIAYALGYKMPVIGLHSWALRRPDGSPEPMLISATTPSDAVDKAIAAALRHEGASPGRRR